MRLSLIWSEKKICLFPLYILIMLFSVIGNVLILLTLYYLLVYLDVKYLLLDIDTIIAFDLYLNPNYLQTFNVSKDNQQTRN